ncbi:MAG: hypothetical protein K6F00_05485, partial [Lachnospiraceae bacterium]|nr:hypothetical protein [Lachnospiraceae bacterium]
MIQKNFHIIDQTADKVNEILNRVSNSDEYKNATQVLLLIFEENWDENYINEQIKSINHYLPKVEIAGITHHDTMYSVDKNVSNVILNFMFFENEAFCIKKCDIDDDMSDV